MTISVQSVTLERALEIEASSVVDAQVVDGNVLLTMQGGTVFNAGSIGNVSDIQPATVVTIDSFDMAPYDTLVPEFYRQELANEKLANPATLPAGYIFSLDWSPDTQYLAALADTSPHLYIYKRSGDVLTKLPNPAWPPTSVGSCLRWSPDGLYLAVASEPSPNPYLTIYKRSGDVLAILTNPVQPPWEVEDISWSPDGVYLAVTHESSPYITVYKRSGDVFTKIANPSVLPPAHGWGVGWSPSGLHLAVGHHSAPYVTIYKRSGDVLTKLPDPEFVPNDYPFSVAWSSDGRYLVLGGGDPFITIYKRSGDTFVRLAAPDMPMLGGPRTMQWSPDNQYLVVSEAIFTEYGQCRVYKKLGDELHLTTMFKSAPIDSTSGFCVRFSPDGVYLAMGVNQTGLPARFVVYKSSMQIPPGEPAPVVVLP